VWSLYSLFDMEIKKFEEMRADTSWPSSSQSLRKLTVFAKNQSERDSVAREQGPTCHHLDPTNHVAENVEFLEPTDCSQ
jgi:hypothetical protein